MSVVEGAGLACAAHMQKELILFLELASFFRKIFRIFFFANRRSAQADRDAPFILNDETQHSFDSLRQAQKQPCSAPVIALPRFGPRADDFTLRCDASGQWGRHWCSPDANIG